MRRWIVLSVLALAGCGGAGSVGSGQAGDVPATGFSRLERDTFNRLAVRRNAPIYWVADANGDGAVNPDEVVGLLFYPTAPAWVVDGAFTPAFETLYGELVTEQAGGLPSDLAADEATRRRLVLEDLDQGRPTLVYTDLTSLSEREKTFVEHMLQAARLSDALHNTQLGLDGLIDGIPETDLADRSLFRRNFGPVCRGPRTESDEHCTAIPGLRRVPVGAYPAALQSDEAFCEKLAAHPDAKQLLDPFTVVVQEGEALVARPLTEVWSTTTGALAAELEAAANALNDVQGEAALQTYLRAAALGYRTNDWLAADEAWAAMNATNSRWYVRAAPDETGWDPCSQKAGVHLSFALINPGSLAWQERLAPVQQEMEDAMAALIGPPYMGRRVTFHLPDFIDIVVNAGDDRPPFGATIGQSLPNWGPVANEGRGRTVAMSNLYADPDSLATRRAQAASLLDAGSLAALTDDPGITLYSTILHEAAHNLGPSAEYAVDGKTDSEVFGGPLAATLEEFKAQSAALWYTEFLRQRGIVDEVTARAAYLDSVVWSFGHIARGMVSPSGHPKPYSQLSAIQIGFLMDAGAIEWRAEAPAANGTDNGAFVLHLDKFPAAIEDLMRTAGQIKGAGDVARAQELVARYVDGDVVPMAAIKERVLRNPKNSFVFSVRLR